jgi:hypothetical protein
MKAPALGIAALLLAATTLIAQQNAPTIEAPTGARAILQLTGDGVQIYTCADASPNLKWTLQGPEAKLLDASGKVVGNHFRGPTWKLSDGGQVQGDLIASRPSPDPVSAPWLLLRAKPDTATGSLAGVVFIRRTDTHGGAAPNSGCVADADAGKTERVPYTATYTFYAAQ